MLNELFPSLYGSSGNGGTDLSSGGNPQHLNSDIEQGAISQLSTIPKQVNPSDVYAVARREANIEGNAELMQLWSERSLSAQQHALRALDVRINHANASMKNETQYRKKLSQHGKHVLFNNVENQAVKENIDAYQQVLASAQSTIKI